MATNNQNYTREQLQAMDNFYGHEAYNIIREELKAQLKFRIPNLTDDQLSEAIESYEAAFEEILSAHYWEEDAE